MWESDDPGRKMSSGLNSNPITAYASIQRIDSWVWVTPLAGPVLPEVKKIAAGLEESMGSKTRPVGLVPSRVSKCGSGAEASPA